MTRDPHPPQRRRAVGPPVLTRDLVRVVHPAPVTEGEAAMTLLSHDEVDALAEREYEAAGRPDEVWVFAYGSLMWRPEISVDEERVANVRGWHRRFCLWQWRNRGNLAKPGLMLALDRGGACRGLALKLAGGDVKERMRTLWRREMRGTAYRIRWLPAVTPRGTVSAVTFVINRDCGRYTGRLDDETTARHIATACGSRGPSSEYLCETVLRCHELGIADPYLHRLQALVAAHLHTARGEEKSS